MIPFNKPYLTGKETDYIRDAVSRKKISGNGEFTKRCQHFFENKYGFKKCLLTTSCTDALEMAAILTKIEPGDEVIVPSYTFVSTANAFILRGAKIVFADCLSHHPNIDHNQIKDLVTSKTKAIVVVHYAGVACNMDEILEVAEANNILVIEDAAQAIDSSYKGRPLGSIGHLAAFSFHETKNIISGEGGMLVINDERFIERAEIIWEKGTNRSAFFRGEVDKYNWVDIGSSFLPSEVTAAFLYAQLENLEDIQSKRILLWEKYFDLLEGNVSFSLPIIPDFASNNAHMFYLICEDEKERNALIKYLRENEIYSVFHYLSLHKSPYFQQHYSGKSLPNSLQFEEQLLRLPLFYELELDQVENICNKILQF